MDEDDSKVKVTEEKSMAPVQLLVLEERLITKKPFAWETYDSKQSIAPATSIAEKPFA